MPGGDNYGEPYRRPSSEEEKSYLEDAIKDLEDEIKYMKERLQELSKEKRETP